MGNKGLRLVRSANAHPWWSCLLFLFAGVALHFAVESWWKALGVMVGAILIDIAVDLAFTKAEEEAGEID